MRRVLKTFKKPHMERRKATQKEREHYEWERKKEKEEILERLKFLEQQAELILRRS